MQIIISLDPIDINDPLAIDPVGSIAMISGQTKLTESAVYVDSWLKAIAAGISEIRKSSRAEIDLIEEPHRLIFESEDNSIRISFKSQFVVAKSLQEIEIALAEATEYLSNHQVFPNVSSEVN